MTDKARRVLNGYAELSESEKEWVKIQINQYDRSSALEKSATKRSIQESVVLGPLETGCPCCGR